MNIPAGWKLVPMEPTPAMVEAAFDALPNSPLEGRIRTHYRAMLAAAPTPPAQQDDEALELLRQAAHALDEAADSIADWASYASDYFREKHDYEGDLKRTRDAAAHFRALIAKRGAA